MIIALALTGCSAGQVKHVNRAGAMLTVASMACDWGGTRQAAGERTDDWEGGGARMIIGGSPSVGRVDAYFAATTVIILTLAELIPDRYRWIGYGTVIAGEAYTAAGNLYTTRGVCGLDP